MTSHNTGEGQRAMTFGETAVQLVANGWLPVPLKLGIDAKRPDIKENWPDYRFSPGDENKWAANGVGLIGANYYGIDIDVYDPDLVQEIMAVSKDILPDGLLHRVGNAPKVALIGRCKGQHMGAYATRSFVAPKQPKHWLAEIIGPRSQLVAFGINPDSKTPYRWHGRTPLEVKLADLPEVTPDQIRELFDFIDELLATCGFLMPLNNQHRTDGTRVHVGSFIRTQPLETDRADDLREAMTFIKNDDLSAREWAYIGMAIKGALGDAGEDIFVQWSRTSSKSGKSGKTDTPSRRYKRFVPHSLGAGTIFYLAQLKGWRAKDGKRYDKPERPPEHGLVKFRNFVDSLQQPDYLLDGILQRGWLYCLTAKTGAGKTAVAIDLSIRISEGKPLNSLQTVAGRVVYLSGENPEDVKARCLLVEQMHKVSDPDIFFLEGALKLEAHVKWLIERIEKLGEVSLVIVDTSASYFGGDDDNSNVELGEYARMFRLICKSKSRPTVLVLAHPTKNATKDNLVPRGGGAFLNEVDGNLTLWTDDNTVTTLHHQGKFRGANFEPIQFRLQMMTHQKYTDSKGRLLPSVLAVPLDFTQAEKLEEESYLLEDRILLSFADHPDLSVRERARLLGMVNALGQAQGSSLQFKIADLKARKLLVSVRKGKVKLTAEGEKEVAALRGKTSSKKKEKQAD